MSLISRAKAQVLKLCLDPNASSDAKAGYRRPKVETLSSAADRQCYQDSTMAQLQMSMRKGDTHTQPTRSCRSFVSPAVSQHSASEISNLARPLSPHP